MNKIEPLFTPSLQLFVPAANAKCPYLLRPGQVEGGQAVSRILRLPDVMQATGLSKASIYLGIKHGTFPRPVKLGARAVGWPSEVVEGWMKSRPPAVA